MKTAIGKAAAAAFYLKLGRWRNRWCAHTEQMCSVYDTYGLGFWQDHCIDFYMIQTKRVNEQMHGHFPDQPLEWKSFFATVETAVGENKYCPFRTRFNEKIV